MALGLEEINKINKSNNIENESVKERVLRPWEGFEKLKNRTRTVSAVEAVEKARQTVQRNNEMTRNLKIQEIETKCHTSITPTKHPIKPRRTSGGFIDFIRAIFSL